MFSLPRMTYSQKMSLFFQSENHLMFFCDYKVMHVQFLKILDSKEDIRREVKTSQVPLPNGVNIDRRVDKGRISYFPSRVCGTRAACLVTS